MLHHIVRLLLGILLHRLLLLTGSLIRSGPLCVMILIISRAAETSLIVGVALTLASAIHIWEHLCAGTVSVRSYSTWCRWNILVRWLAITLACGRWTLLLWASLMVMWWRFFRSWTFIMTGTIWAFLLIKHTCIQIAKSWVSTKVSITVTHVACVWLVHITTSMVIVWLRVRYAVLRLGLSGLLWLSIAVIALVGLRVVALGIRVRHLHWIVHLVAVVVVGSRHRTLGLIQMVRLRMHQRVILS